MQRLTYAAMAALVKSKQSGKDLSTFIFDVRDPDEIKSTGIIPTAVNFPLGEIDAALKKSATEFQTSYGFNKPELTDRVVTYCVIGKRAQTAATIFTTHDYKNVDVYPGGWEEWSNMHKEEHRKRE